MNAKDREHFKGKLIEKKTALLNSVKKAETYGREAETEEESMDLVDKASSSYTKEFMFSKSNSERRFLVTVNEALDRLEQGEFGDCLNCEEPIGRKRLEALPWARLCIDCQELEEKGKL